MRNEYFRLLQLFYNLLESPNLSIKIFEYIFVVPTVLLKMSWTCHCCCAYHRVHRCPRTLEIFHCAQGMILWSIRFVVQFGLYIMSRKFNIIFVTWRFSIMQFIPYIFSYICSSKCINSEIWSLDKIVLVISYLYICVLLFGFLRFGWLSTFFFYFNVWTPT